MVMHKENSDSFELQNLDSFNNKETSSVDNFFEVKADNFFLNGDFNLLPAEPARRLNAYDSTLLEEDAYKEVSDELFKLEYKIAKIEEELNGLDNRIQSARDIYDYDQIESLSLRKRQLSDEYSSLIKMYNEMSISAKISDGILNIFGGRRKVKSNIPDGVKALKRGWDAFSAVVMSKMPKRFSSVLELKKSLSKLESINKNVDELIGMNIPYGENRDKYEQLSKYILRANSIQNSISKIIK